GRWLPGDRDGFTDEEISDFGRGSPQARIRVVAVIARRYESRRLAARLHGDRRVAVSVAVTVPVVGRRGARAVAAAGVEIAGIGVAAPDDHGISNPDGDCSK